MCVISLIFLVFAYKQKNKVDILEAAVEDANLQLEECKRSREQLIQQVEAQRMLEDEMRRMAEMESARAYERLRHEESKLK